MEKIDFDNESEKLKPFISFLDENVRQVDEYDLNIIDLQIEMGKEMLKDQWERIKDLESKRLHVSFMVIGIVPYYFFKIFSYKYASTDLGSILANLGVFPIIATIWYSFKHYGGLDHFGGGSLPSIQFSKLTVKMNLKEHKLSQLANIEFRARINKTLMLTSNIQLIRQMQSLLLTVIFLVVFISLKETR